MNFSNFIKSLRRLRSHVLTPLPLLLLFFFSVSRPDKVFFPPANWKVTKNYGVEQDVGPAVEHIYEVISHSCTHSLGPRQIGLESTSTVHKASQLTKASTEGEKRANVLQVMLM